MFKLKSGMKTLLAMNKEIEADEKEEKKSSKVVKLRFTRKQYQVFRDACKILEIIASEEGFTDFVKKALGADVKTPTIARQFVNPIVEAPMRIPVKIPRAVDNTKPRKESYFTAPTEATEKAMRLYSQVADEVEGLLRYNLQYDSSTCVTDVRVMLSKYFASKGLKNENGTVLDEFIRDLAPGSIDANKERIIFIKGDHVVPKDDTTKVVTSIINEVTFDKF